MTGRVLVPGVPHKPQGDSKSAVLSLNGGLLHKFAAPWKTRRRGERKKKVCWEGLTILYMPILGRLSRRETGFGFIFSIINFTETKHFKINALVSSKRVNLFETETKKFSYFTVTVYWNYGTKTCFSSGGFYCCVTEVIHYKSQTFQYKMSYMFI